MCWLNICLSRLRVSWFQSKRVLIFSKWHLWFLTVNCIALLPCSTRTTKATELKTLCDDGMVYWRNSRGERFDNRYLEIRATIRLILHFPLQKKTGHYWTRTDHFLDLDSRLRLANDSKCSRTAKRTNSFLTVLLHVFQKTWLLQYNNIDGMFLPCIDSPCSYWLTDYVFLDF